MESLRQRRRASGSQRSVFGISSPSQTEADSPQSSGDSEMANGDSTQGPSKRAKSEVNTPDERADVSPLVPTPAQPPSLPVSSTGPPGLLSSTDPDPTPAAPHPNGHPAGFPGQGGGTDPAAQPKAEDIAPPPAIAGMEPLSATAREGFASAANGVVDGAAGSAASGQRGMGRVVLNGTAGQA